MMRILEAEVRGCFHGLKPACSSGNDKMLIESDSKCATELIGIQVSTSQSLYSLALTCKEINPSFLRNVYREANNCADQIVRNNQWLPLGSFSWTPWLFTSYSLKWYTILFYFFIFFYQYLVCLELVPFFYLHGFSPMISQRNKTQ